MKILKPLNLKLAINMKNIFKSLLFIFIINLTNTINAQTNVVPRGGGYVYQDLPAGTYIKDINNTFTNFLGTWKWQDGNKILIFKIEKVSEYYHPEFDVYEDFMIGNYSYTEDNGATYLVNTILQNIGIQNPELVPLYTSGPINDYEIKFAFTDVLLNKIYCNANFKFLPNSFTQLSLKLLNQTRGYMYPEPTPPVGFSIPNNVVLIKQ